MVYSEELNYLFIARSHTASTAISHELREHYAGVAKLRKHASLINAEKALRKENVAGFFKFCGVRNPLDIGVTRYEKMRINLDGLFTTPSGWKRNGGWITDDQFGRFAFIQTGKSFSDYVRAFPDSRPKTNVKQLARFDFVMRNEDQPQAFSLALKACGIEPFRELPVVNATSGKRHFLDYYETDDLREIAVRMLHREMAAQGYEFPDAFPDSRDLARTPK